MENEYKFETFKANAGSFDYEFTNFLNSKSKESWNVKTCSYCHDQRTGKTYASCIFEKR